MVLRKRYLELFVVGLFLVILLSFGVFAVGDLMALQGNVDQGGSALSSGNLTVTIYDAPVVGTMIYNSTTDFDNAISSGKYNVLLGNGSNDLNLEYGKKYYMELFVNNEQFNFGSASRQMFQAGIGAINSSFMNLTYLNVGGDLNVTGNLSVGDKITFRLGEIIDNLVDGWLKLNGSLQVTNNLNVTGNITLFGRVGIGTETPTHLLTVVGAINATGTINSTIDICIEGGNCLSTLTGGNLSWNETRANGLYIAGNNETLIGLINNASYLSTYNATYAGYGLLINSSWNETRADEIFMRVDGDNGTGDYNFNGGWQSDGLTISGGDIYAQTIFVYNITSLAVDSLRINGTFTPSEGFDNQFDIGSSSLRWKDLYLSGQVLSNGTGDNFMLGNLGIGTSTPGATLEVVGSINATGTINSTIDICIEGGNCLSTLSSGNLSWNETRANSLYISGGNLSIYNGLINNASYLSTYNLTYDAKADYQFLGNNFNGSGNLTIVNGGRLGIGTSAPEYELQVIGNTSLDDVLYVLDSGQVGIGTATPASGTKLEISGGALRVDNSVTDDVFQGYTYNAGAAGVNFLLTHVTSSPANDDWAAEIVFSATNNNSLYPYIATMGAKITNITAGLEGGALIFSTMTNGVAATEKLRITSEGNINITSGNLTLNNNNRICLDGEACTHFMYWNGTHTVIE